MSRDSVKFPSLSEWISVSSRSMIINDLDHPVDRKWVKFTCFSSTEYVFSRSIVVNDLLSLVDQSDSSFPSLPSNDCLFKINCRGVRKVPAMESEWNSFLSPWITSLPFPDLRSRMARTIPSIESNWIHSCLHWLNLFLFQIHASTKISTLPAIESEWNLLPSSSAKSVFSRSTAEMIWTILWVESKWKSLVALLD